MSEVAQYQRISTESDEEFDDIKIQPQPHVRSLKNLHGKKVEHSNAIKWNCECISRLIASYILLMVALGFVIHSMPPIQHLSHQEEHHHVYRKAAVAAGNEECSKVGVSILKEGGTAVDAAIATMLCEGVVEPEFSGIGGGFFMVVYNKSSNSSTIIDAREIAPGKSTRNMLSKLDVSSTAPLSIGIPGELKGYSYAYKKFGGGVSWKRLFQAAIDKAENGFAIDGQLAIELRRFKDKIIKSKTLCEIYGDSSRTDVKEENEVAKNPALAKFLTLIGEKGAEVFYDSTFTDTLVNEIKEEGGIVSKEDFTAYEVKEKSALRVELSNDRALLVPPLPSGGPVLSIIMSILDQYHANDTTFLNRETSYWHRTVESFKHAFGKGTHFGDPAFVSGVNELVSEILDPENISKLKEKINDEKTFDDVRYYGAKPNHQLQHLSSTSHISVLAPNGDAVAVTSSLNAHFGSFFMSPSTGVLFNNQMEDFFTEVEHTNDIIPNQIEPGKRPMSCMSPCIVLNTKTNEAVYVIGGAGGKQIPTAVALSLLRLLYFGADDFDEAIRAPRIHHQLTPNVLYYEKEFNQSIIKDLKKKGHQVEMQTPLSFVNGIKNHVSHIHAFSDLRSKGAEADGW